jgi:hypothetical protein
MLSGGNPRNLICSNPLFWSFRPFVATAPQRLFNRVLLCLILTLEPRQTPPKEFLVQKIVLGVHGLLCATGADDIELLVHSQNVGSPSPCHVLEDRIHRGTIAGSSIRSLDEVFDRQAAKHPGFRVKERRYFVTQLRDQGRKSWKPLKAA